MSLPFRWVPCELHAHSVHSDGRLTVVEMAREARRLGLEAVALTDHNTNSGIGEIADAERASGVTIIPGMELTTFYGHLLAWGTAAYVEWRSLTRANVDSAIAAIHAAGGLAGVAHPFNPGSPFCTGCCWDFDGPDWSHVDFVEVWSEADPWKKPKNRKALQLWNDLLNQGHRVVGTSARDFHAPDPDCLPSVTYLGIREQRGGAREQRRRDREQPGRAHDLIAGAKEALRAGRVFVTLGPFLSIEGRAAERSAGPGETLSQEGPGALLVVDVAWGSNGRRLLWEPALRTLAVVVRGSQGELARTRVEGPEGTSTFALPRKGNRWIRAELHGLARGDEAMIAFTNPIYLE